MVESFSSRISSSERRRDLRGFLGDAVWGALVLQRRRTPAESGNSGGGVVLRGTAGDGDLVGVARGDRGRGRGRRGSCCWVGLSVMRRQGFC